MSKKKSDEPALSAEQQELERKVDAMMSVERTTDSRTDRPLPTKSTLRIITDTEPLKTAPDLPAKLRKAAAKPAEPVTAAAPQFPPAAESAATADPVADPDSGEAAAAPAEAETPTPAPIPDQTILDDSQTDEAVEDIVAHEGDTQLAVEDAVARQRTEAAEAGRRPGPVIRFFTSLWLWLFVLMAAAVIYLWYR